MKISDYAIYYNLENYLLTEVRENFNNNKSLNTFEFFSIIIWKANRAKTKIAEKLKAINTNLDVCIKNITNEIYNADNPKEKMKILIEKYNFRLPMTSAILSILYPEDFTVYDVRVCETLIEFKGLINKVKFETIWSGYQKYVIAVNEYIPENLTLREKDKALWGKSFYDQLWKDIGKEFPKRTNHIHNLNS